MHPFIVDTKVSQKDTMVYNINAKTGPHLCTVLYDLGSVWFRECSFEKCWGGGGAKPARNSCDPPKSNAEFTWPPPPPPDKITTQAL